MGEAAAQFGLRLKYNSNNFNNWEEAINDRFGENNPLYATGFEAGLDYWFRLKKRRIEFFPEISYAIANTRYENPVIEQFNFNSFNFNFHTQIYALDMEGDCDCPTFSKQGPLINKGLFFHFTPGISGYQAEVLHNPISSQRLDPEKISGVAFKAGVGVGLDLGVSDLLTITPIISYYFHSALNWKNLAVQETVFMDSSVNPSQLQFTLRIGFRPDYGRKGRFR